MNKRYLHHHVVTHSLYPLCKRKEHRYDNKNNRADYIKENVHNRGTFWICLCTDCRKKRGNTGTYILTENNIYRERKRHKPLRCESLKYAYACRRALYNARNSGAYEYAYNRIVRIYNPVAENLGILKRIHGVLHKLHTHKQHAETGECLPDIFQRILFGKKNHKRAYKYSYRSYPGKIQRNKNACGCGTDICTHNDAYNLPECHNSAVYKADCHNRNSARRLNNSRNEKTEQYTLNPAIGHFFKNCTKLAAAHFFKAFAHNVHTEKEHGKPANKS